MGFACWLCKHRGSPSAPLSSGGPNAVSRCSGGQRRPHRFGGSHVGIQQTPGESGKVTSFARFNHERDGVGCQRVLSSRRLPLCFSQNWPPNSPFFFSLSCSGGGEGSVAWLRTPVADSSRACAVDPLKSEGRGGRGGPGERCCLRFCKSRQHRGQQALSALDSLSVLGRK